MTFEEFDQAAWAAGLRARCCSPIHWQILGGKRQVNVWPVTKRGFRMQASGKAATAGTVSEAIALAGGPRTEEPVTDAMRTCKEHLETLGVRYAEKMQAAFVEQGRREGWLVEGTGTAQPPSASLTPAMVKAEACPWEKEQLGVIRRFWRWLW